VAVNNALIEDSINNADIKQVSGVNNWSPNAGGICVVNNASIKHVVNSGKISVVSTLEGDDIGGTVYVSGISVINCGEIQKSLNKGEINATSKEIMVFAGGISASSEFTTSGMQQILPVINECGNQGDVNVVTQDERAYVFAGGISGFVYGIVKNSYSTADFEKEYAEGKYFVGTFLGAVDVDYYGGAYVAIEEIYVKELENPSFHVGASFLSSYDIDGVLVNRSIYGLGFDFNAHVNVESLEELVLQEVYWNE